MAKQADHTMLQMALIGYEERRRTIESAIADIQKQLGGRVSKSVASSNSSRPKRVLSAAGRKRIREALKRRWAEYAKQKTQGAKPAKAKTSRTLSPARRAALAANLAKARAAKAAKQAQGAAG